MNINKTFSKIEIEDISKAVEIEKKIGLALPTDYIEFREKIGGIFMDGGNGPALILDSDNPNRIICGLYKFYNFNDLSIEYEKMKKDINKTFHNLNEKKLIPIGYGEGQFEIYIGYGDKNYNNVYLFLVEDGELKEYGRLENFINNYIIEYNEKYF